MPALQYRGARAAAPADLAYLDYLTQVKGADLSVAEIDNVINSGLSGYATIAYVDSQDALNATKAYIDAGDAQRLKLTQKGIANGVAPLDATGRVPTQRINAPLTQKWVRGPWTPPAYHAAAQNVTAEQTLYTCPVTDPGYPYKLVIFGTLDGHSSLETEWALINIRVANATSGEIVAQGLGAADAPDAAVPVNGEAFNTVNPDGLGDNWNQTVLAGVDGHYQVINGQAQWVQGGNQDRQWRFRRLGPDALTVTNYQKVRLTIGAAVGESPFLGSPQRVKLCARMNTAENDWVGFEITDDTFTMQYCINGTISVPSGAGWTLAPGASFSTSPDSGTTYDVLAGTVNSLKQFLYYRNNVLIGGAVDVNGITKADAGHRGWGWYAEAAGRAVDQCDPPDIAELFIADAPPSSSSISIVPANVGGSSVRTGATTLFIRAVRSGASSTQLISTYQPRLTIFAVPT